MSKRSWFIIYCCILTLFLWAVARQFEIELKKEEIELERKAIESRVNESGDYLPKAYYIN